MGISFHPVMHIIRNIPSPLVEEANDLSRYMLSSRLLVIHDASRGSENDVAKLTGWKQLNDPLLHVSELHVVSGRDDTSLVQPAVELDDDLTVAVVVDFLEFADVALRKVSMINLKIVVLNVAIE
jgi:hypothetical protein